MRLSDVEINPSTLKLEIDIMDKEGSFAVVVCDGRAKVAELPLHGEMNIVTHQGKVKRIRWNEGEDFK
ncbi:XtrA/YqaO family protein [Rossellomorea vietnamensis]|uniref:XtrA/YqaO family protein n=1 Tax=Rossellomorea vietnamensis TaxID=218284 RepID=UPI0005565B21|nr:XtrA/YqaO family protein [Rossellomorea vietnamensis]